jgi:Zn-dependent protease with chaperone function/tetratricopeptide (TPR) repeat protein
MRLFAGWRALGRVALLLALATPALGRAAAPAADLFGKSLDAAVEAVRVYGSWDEPKELRRVADIGYRVAQESGFRDFPISFYLIELAEPNAFALPGGQVFVTRGMLATGLGDDELAALLGHEIAHVVNRHGTRIERRATLLNILSQAALIGVMLTESRQDSRDERLPYPYGLERDPSSANTITGTYAAGMILSELLLRSYSREFEDEADDDGQRWAAAAGFAQDGTEQLMAVLGSRLPDSKEYGYWRTHPFFAERLAVARVRAGSLSRGAERPTAEFRSWSQKQILELGAQARERKPPKPPATKPEPRPEGGGPEPKLGPDAATSAKELVERAALTAWPRGVEAERLRLEQIHRLRDATLLRVPIARDYGKLLASYDRELAAVAEADPQSPLLVTLRTEREALAAELPALYTQAREIWAGGVYETAFLETFASNWPDGPEAPAVALALGEAYSRTGRQADAVDRFLAAAKSGDEPVAVKARRALGALAPTLDQLTALAELAAQPDDADLAAAAHARLEKVAGTYADIATGAAYLARFPAGAEAPRVAARLNVLAENLYGEVVLYQSLGDHLKAIDRMQRILTHAPASPAAQKLLERVVLPT